MEIGKFQKIVIAITAAFVIITLLLVFGGNFLNDLGNKKRKDASVMPEADSFTDEIKADSLIEETFVSDLASISDIGIVFVHDYIASNGGVTIELLESGNVITSDTYASSTVEDQHRTFLKISPALNDSLKKEYVLRIYSSNGNDTGLKVLVSKSANATYKMNNRIIKGTLCFSIEE